MTYTQDEERFETIAERADAEVAALTAQVAEATARYTAAEASVGSMDADLSAARVALAAAQQALSTAQSNDSTDAAKIADLTSQVATLTQRVTDTGALLASAQAAAAKAASDLAAAQATVAGLRADLAAAQAAAGSGTPSADYAALVAALAAVQKAGGTPTAGPASQPVIAGSRVATPGVGTLNTLNAGIALGTVVVLPEGTFSVKDFRQPSNSPTYAHFLHKIGELRGSGKGKSIITIDPNTLDFTNTTDAEIKLRPRIENIKEPNTDPYNLMRTDAAVLIQDLTLVGTVQGTDPVTGKEYSYHGLQIFGTTNPTLRRVLIKHIPGSKGVPPNETFPVYFYRVKGKITMEDVEIDGDGVGSSGVSGQPEPGVDLSILLNRVKMKGGPNGAGWTSFNRAFKSIRLVDVNTDGSLVLANFEQVVVNGGNADGKKQQGEGVVIVRPKATNPSGYRSGEPTWKQAYWHLALDSSDAGGTNGKSQPGVSNRVDVYDPILADGEKFKVCISAGYGYQDVPVGNQCQRGTDVHIWTGGAWIGDPAEEGSRYVGGTERPDLMVLSRSTGAGLPAN